jgi:hypothetical protein
VPPVSLVPDALRGKAFRGSDALSSGLLTPNQLRGPAWRRLFPDVYAHVSLPVTHLLRAQAAARWVVVDSTVTGRSAAAFWEVELAGPDEPVELTVPPGRHPVRVAGLTVRRSRLAPDHVRRRYGALITTPAATAVRLAGLLQLDDVVVAMDQLVAARVVDLASIRAAAASARGSGSRRARAAAHLADGLAASPPETRLRLLISRSGLPDPVAQFDVRDGRRVVARVDFAWPERRVALEYDGLWHAEDASSPRIGNDSTASVKPDGWWSS